MNFNDTREIRTNKQIDYPGMNNNSQFSFDGQSRNSKIVETVSGSVTSTKQFVWCNDDKCEVRDGGATVISLYFDSGQTISGTSYFYAKNHPGSITEMVDGSGVLQAQYAFDPFGRRTKLQASLDSDFQYAGYFQHARSGLNLTLTRAYNPNNGRWLNRDTIEEVGGVNLYTYVSNNPIAFSDPLGFGRKEDCCEAKKDLANTLRNLNKRMQEQAAGSKDPKIVKSHQKAIEQAKEPVRDAIRRWRLYCGKDDPPPDDALKAVGEPVSQPQSNEGGGGGEIMIPPMIDPRAIWNTIRDSIIIIRRVTARGG